jgi:hypothetical protein
VCGGEGGLGPQARLVSGWGGCQRLLQKVSCEGEGFRIASAWVAGSCSRAVGTEERTWPRRGSGELALMGPHAQPSRPNERRAVLQRVDPTATPKIVFALG